MYIVHLTRSYDGALYILLVRPNFIKFCQPKKNRWLGISSFIYRTLKSFDARCQKIFYNIGAYFPVCTSICSPPPPPPPPPPPASVAVPC
jgi:hypothetical protein